VVARQQSSRRPSSAAASTKDALSVVLNEYHGQGLIMQRLILVISCVLFACSTASGELWRSYGVKGGACSATQIWDRGSQIDQGTGYRWGVDVGIFAELADIPPFSLSTEIHYVQKGMKYDIPVTTEQFPNGTGEFITVDPSLNYLSVPLLAKLRVDLSRSEVYLLVGPRFDFLLSSDGDGQFDSQIKRFNSFDFGGTIGVGFQTRTILGLATGVEFRFSPSFQSGYEDDFVTITNRSFEFLLTIGR